MYVIAVRQIENVLKTNFILSCKIIMKIAWKKRSIILHAN